MTRVDYTKLDEAILAVLAAGPKTFAAFSYRGDVNAAAVELEKTQAASPSGTYDKPAWRFVDGRLQALRKAGKIQHLGPKEGWALMKAKGGAQ